MVDQYFNGLVVFMEFITLYSILILNFLNLNYYSNYNKLLMILRKPTKIELKPEDDLYEYEDFKKKQSDFLRN
jgi:hypothetical protein